MMTDEMRKAHAEVLEDQAAAWMPNVIALTLQYNTHVTAATIRADLNRFSAHVDQAIHGRRFHKHERSRFWAVIESQKFDNKTIVPTFSHVHAAWKLPDKFGIDDLRKIMTERLWLRFAWKGSYDIQEYRFKSDTEEGWAAYATKTLTSSEYIF